MISPFLTIYTLSIYKSFSEEKFKYIKLNSFNIMKLKQKEPKSYGPFFSMIYEIGSRYSTHRQYLKKFLSQAELQIDKDTNILDAGCGSGRLAVSLLSKLRKEGNIETKVHGVDVSKFMLKIAEKNALKKKVRENLTLYCADGQNLSYAHEFKNKDTNGNIIAFADDSYDIVMSSGLLECVPDPYMAIKEMQRVLKPGGIMVLSVVNKNKLGKLASKMLGFNLVSTEYLMQHFDKIRFTKFKVDTKNFYMKHLKSIYVGTKV